MFGIDSYIFEGADLEFDVIFGVYANGQPEGCGSEVFTQIEMKKMNISLLLKG